MRAPDFPAYYTLLDKAGWWALRGFGVALLVFLLLPILVIVPLSFSSSSFLAYPIPGFSLQWYENLFTSSVWIRAAKNSFIVAPAATASSRFASMTTRVWAMRLARFPDRALDGAYGGMWKTQSVAASSRHCPGTSRSPLMAVAPAR